ncbi:MFS transporter [Lactiplantibacillus pentosus]|uniref:MFS transporter n=1 Tax=Lactiplantibacillus pentosus TaxID=1589 RepID=UPI001C20152D|nr:MFS transporter [Lactiplantibacillus pentosus]MBU7503894.1 MFS transporter [Lactiplantibacillus pentosus]MDY1545168.1 MFS transporter [Lactiplantibacillus pentosus]
MLSPLIRRNLQLSYGYAACSFFGITTLWVIFLQQRGLSLVAIGLCESIFHLTSFLSEVPSGVIADRFGYRSVLISSRLMAIGHAIIMLTAHSLGWFLLAFVLQAWAYNLQSGTLAAAQYDSLVAADATRSYPHVTTVLNTTIEIADTVGVVLAGWLLGHHLIWTYWIYLVAALVAVLLTAGLKIPAVVAPTESRPGLRQITVAAWHVLQTQPRLRALILFDAVFSAVSTTYYYYFQTVMTAHHFTSPKITTILVIGLAVNVAAIQLTPWLQAHFAQRRLLIGLCGGLTIALLGSFNSAPNWLISAYLVINGLQALLAPLLSNYYNQLIPNGQRATLLSVASMGFSLAMVGSFPGIGWLIQHWGFTLTFGTSGLLILIVGLGWLLKVKPHAVTEN